jgi:hypothetical protein
MAHVLVLFLGLALSATAQTPSADEYVPDPITKRKRPATLWKLRVEGEDEARMVPVYIMKEYGLRAGQVVSIHTARRMAIDMGAEYPPDILEHLEALK